MKKAHLTNFLILTVAICITASAQDEGFLYGKITNRDGRSYEGPIRWGKEEVYWIDVFNASKDGNEYIHYLTHDQRDRLDERRHDHNYFSSSAWRWISWSNNGYDKEFSHQFSCQFGEIKSLKPLGRDRVQVEMQNGIRIDVDGSGYNDVGEEIKIIDHEMGELQIDWRDIDRIEFKPTPSKLAQKFGQPMYGTVDAYSKSFTGYIQWDHDERLSSDKLDGDSDDGKVALLFEKIRTLERHFNRTVATMKSGRQLELRGSNDVNSGNRGIIVTTESGLIVDVPWDEFKRVTFADAAAKPLKRYEDFKNQRELSATITTADGKTLSGKVVIDLDETYDFELYQGKDADVEFSVALRNVKKITVKNGERVTLELKNGENLSLAESQDVGELNQGVLVFVGKEDPRYVPWDNVGVIQFN